METLRLRRIQQPSQVDRLLEAFVWRSQRLPKDAYQIRDPKALPAQLQAILAQTAEEGRTWACWADRFHILLFTCEMSLALSRERGGAGTARPSV